MKHAEYLTRDILEDAYLFDEVIPPIDLNKVLEDQGFTLYQGEFKDPDMMGVYFREEKKIYVRSNTVYANKAFLTAKALGHYFLHPQIEERTFYRIDLIPT